MKPDVTEDLERANQAMIREMASGSAHAFKAYYDTNATWVYAVATRILGDNRDSHDAVQETFLRAWRRASTYEASRGSAGAWLTFLARNTSIDILRKRRRVLRVEEEVAKLAPTVIYPEEGTDENLHGALKALTPAQKRALELSFYEGWSNAEVAERMGLTLGGVKNHLRRGLELLRKHFKRHDG